MQGYVFRKSEREGERERDREREGERARVAGATLLRGPLRCVEEEEERSQRNRTAWLGAPSEWGGGDPSSGPVEEEEEEEREREREIVEAHQVAIRQAAGVLQNRESRPGGADCMCGVEGPQFGLH